jgi:hypothetical protein
MNYIDEGSDDKLYEAHRSFYSYLQYALHVYVSIAFVSTS